MLRIAMWSGPRNISTAMMRSWENREDTCVVDEPLYAHYLRASGIDHPGTAEILKSQNNDWKQVTAQLLNEQPDSRCSIYYQKHMSHHLLESMQTDWLLSLCNCFLIRDPDSVVASYAEKRPDLTPEDLGYTQLLRIYELVCANQDEMPPVIDSDLFLKAPKQQLQILCDRLEIDFSERMLQWPPGKRDSDGVWAKYWYHNVERSRGFMPWKPRELSLSSEQQKISDACRPIYETLLEHCIKTD